VPWRKVCRLADLYRQEGKIGQNFQWISSVEDSLFDALLKYNFFPSLKPGTSDFQSQNHTPRSGRAIAQAVSPWLPTVAARVRAWICSSGISGGQSGAGAGFLRVLQFPLPIFIPQILHLHNHPGRYSRLISGRHADWIQFGLHPPLCELKRITRRSTSRCQCNYVITLIT
jgi:hypothetical protein